MGSAPFSVPVLERLTGGGRLVAAVFTQPDRPSGRGRAPAPSAVKREAVARGIEVFQPTSLRGQEAAGALARLRPDVIVVAAYGLLLPPEVLGLPPCGCLNVHPSLLPRYRGPSPIQWAILEGDEWSGVTVMLMDAGMDTGPIVAQRPVAVAADDTALTLGGRLAQEGAQLLEETLPRWCDGAVEAVPQPDEGVTYTRPLVKEDGLLDWGLSAVELGRRVRAFHPWPGCHTRWQGKVLKVIAALPEPGGQGRPGEVLPLPGGGIGVQTGSGVLRLERVQREGGREVDAAEFARGQRGLVGAVLPA